MPAVRGAVGAPLLEEDWYKEGRITLADRVEEEGAHVAALLHGLRKEYYGGR